MANSISALNPEYWAGQIQKSLFVENTAVFLANTTFANLVAGDGDTVNYGSLSYPKTQTYTPGSDLTPTTLSASNEQLTIGTWAAQIVEIDDTEMRQAKYGIRQKSEERMIRGLNNEIEQAFLAEVTNAGHTVDDGNVGGSSGSNIVLDTDKTPLLFTVAGSKLWSVDARSNDRYAIVGPRTYGQLLQYRAGRPTTLGDSVSLNGSAGQAFGWNIVVNNNLPFTAVLSLVTQPTDGDTITIAGITFTFKTSLGSTAGNVLIGASVDAARANLAKAINDSGTVDTHYVQLSAENRWLLTEKRGIAATNDDTADTLTITGYGDITVGETLTDATDTWTSARQDSLFLNKGAIHLIVQIPPFVEAQRNPDQFSTIVKALVGYGKKTFADDAREMVRVKINALGTASGNNHWL